MKGRGRPQRILLGVWPEETIKGVVKTVVFRDAKELREEAGMQLSAFGRHSVTTIFLFVQCSPISRFTKQTPQISMFFFEELVNDVLLRVLSRSPSLINAL